MGWTDFPPSNGENISEYTYITQLWWAVRQRELALGTERWPRHYFEWETGTIDSLVDNGNGTITITDGDKDWLVSVGGGPATTKRWVGYSNPDLPYAPAFYDLIIEINGDDDHEQIIHVQITDNGETTLTARSWQDYVVAGYIDDIDDADGKPYWIIKRGGWWHHERWPVMPNAQEIAAGDVAGNGDTVEISGTTYSRITDETVGVTVGKRAWTNDAFAGKDLLVWDDDGFLQRVTIVGNDDNSIWFAQQSWTGDGDYCVVAPNAKAWPGRERFGIFQWYGGATKDVYTHRPDDDLGTTPVYTDNVIYDEFNADPGVMACEPANHFGSGDADVWSDVQNECDPHEFNFSRYVYATLRGIQRWVEERCAQFVPMDDYHNSDYIPNFTFAELMERIGVNGGTGTISASPDGGGQYHFSVSSDYIGATIYTTIRSAAGGVLLSGSGTVGASGKVTVGTSADYASRPVTWTLGWTRWMPRMVQYMFYPQGACWIADTDEDDLAIEPPVFADGTGAGQWVNRPDISTQYMRYDINGPGDYEDFADGELARYIGDNYADGTTGDDELHGDTPHWEHFYVGQRAKSSGRQHQGAWTASMSGSATSGTTTSLTDADKEWWSVNWYHQPEVEPARVSNPTVRVDTGTATGGSSTTLIDSTKEDDVSNEPECAFWRASRFVSFDSPWEGFILEVDKIVEGETVTYKLPIVSGDADTGTLTFAAVAGFTVQAGDPYRIKEPAYHLNQWKGRTLVLTSPEGEEFETTITHNDHTSLWFEEIDEAVTEGWRYQIVEHQTGGVWLRDGGEWTVPSGADARGATFREDQRNNLPTKTKWYGKVCRGDYTMWPGLYEEIYDALNELQWTIVNASWTSRANDATPENNVYSGQTTGPQPTSGNATISQSWDAALNNAYGGGWATTSENDGLTPQAGITGSIDNNVPTAVRSTAVINGNYAYGKITGVDTLLPCSVDWFAYSQINAADSAPAHSCTVIPGPPPDRNNSLLFADGGSEAIYHKWCKHDSTASAQTSTRKSAKFDVTLPPTGNPNFVQTCGTFQLISATQGFYVSSAKAILKWDMDYV